MTENTNETLDKVTLKADSETVQTMQILVPKYCQTCLLCDNTREIPSYSYNIVPWICDECKEVMAFAKDFKRQMDAVEACSRKETPGENIHPL